MRSADLVCQFDQLGLAGLLQGQQEPLLRCSLKPKSTTSTVRKITRDLTKTCPRLVDRFPLGAAHYRFAIRGHRRVKSKTYQQQAQKREVKHYV